MRRALGSGAALSGTERDETGDAGAEGTVTL
jgi:hypothetical protein